MALMLCYGDFLLNLEVWRGFFWGGGILFCFFRSVIKSSQAAKLIALRRAVILGPAFTMNMYTINKYMFGVCHETGEVFFVKGLRVSQPHRSSRRPAGRKPVERSLVRPAAGRQPGAARVPHGQRGRRRPRVTGAPAAILLRGSR